MSISTLTAARIYLGQLDPSLEEAKLAFDDFPFTAFSKANMIFVANYE